MKFAVWLFIAGALQAQNTHWMATWAAAASPQIEPERMRAQHLELANQTVREIVHVSLGGDTFRVRLSNVFSDRPVEIGAASLALAGSGGSLLPQSVRTLLFGGRPSFQLPAGAIAISDPVTLHVPNSGQLAISLFVEHPSLAGGIHYQANQTTYLASGNVVQSESLKDTTSITSWVLLAGVDVLASANSAAVVALGDSITDGSHSTVDANKRWPDTLGRRLAAQGLAVVDLGIGGNRILHEGSGSKRPEAGVNALARFDRDVLSQPGVRYLVVLEGINDIGHPGSSAPPDEAVTAEDLIGAMKQVVERAHERGIRVIAGTVTPFESDSNRARGYYTPEKEKVRLAFNDWIRKAKVLDGVVDFEKVVRDPEHPSIILKSFDSGDGLHPSDAGYTAMGEAVLLTLFH